MDEPFIKDNYMEWLTTSKSFPLPKLRGHEKLDVDNTPDPPTDRIVALGSEDENTECDFNSAEIQVHFIF